MLLIIPKLSLLPLLIWSSVSILFFQLPGIQEGLKSAGETILTPLVSLDTPGKATVEVVIPADPVSIVFLQL